MTSAPLPPSLSSRLTALAAAALLCVGLVGCVSSQHQKQAASRASLGQAYLQEGNAPNAVRVLEEAVKLDPRNFEAHQNLALAYMAQGALDESEREFKRALRLHPDRGETRNNYGLLLMELERRDEAILQFERALEDLTHRSPALVMSNLGYALYMEGLNERALDQLTMATRRAPNLCEPWFNRGLVYLELGQADLALEDFEASIDKCGERKPSAYIQAGQLRIDSGDVFGGCAYLRQASEGDPHSRTGRAARETFVRSCGRW